MFAAVLSNSAQERVCARVVHWAQSHAGCCCARRPGSVMLPASAVETVCATPYLGNLHIAPHASPPYAVATQLHRFHWQ